MKKKNRRSRVKTTDLAIRERKNRGLLLNICEASLLSVFFVFSRGQKKN